MTKNQPDYISALLDAHIAAQSQRYDQALRFLAQIDPAELNQHFQIHYYQTTGDANLGQNKYDEAHAAFNNALKLLDTHTISELTHEDLLKREQIRNAKGLTFYKQRRHQEALKQHLVCLQAITDRLVTNRRFCFKLYTNLGNDYYQLRNFDMALQMYRDSAKLIQEQAEESGASEDHQNLAEVYWGMALVYRARNDMIQTKFYFSQSAEIYRQVGNTEFEALLNNQLAMVMIDREELAEAEPLLVASRDSATKYGYIDTLANASVNMAYLYYKQQRWLEGQQAAQQGVILARQLGNLTLLAEAMAQLAQIEFAGKLASNSDITDTYEKAMAFVESTNSLEYKYRLSKRGYEFFSETRDMERAMTFMDKMHRYESELKPGVS